MCEMCNGIKDLRRADAAAGRTDYTGPAPRDRTQERADLSQGRHNICGCRAVLQSFLRRCHRGKTVSTWLALAGR